MPLWGHGGESRPGVELISPAFALGPHHSDCVSFYRFARCKSGGHSLGKGNGAEGWFGVGFVLVFGLVWVFLCVCTHFDLFTVVSVWFSFVSVRCGSGAAALPSGCTALPARCPRTLPTRRLSPQVFRDQVCGLCPGHLPQRPGPQGAEQSVPLELFYVYDVQQAALHRRGALYHRRKQVRLQRRLPK